MECTDNEAVISVLDKLPHYKACQSHYPSSRQEKWVPWPAQALRLAPFESASWSPCHSNHKNNFTIQKFFLEPVHCKILSLEWRYTGRWKIRAWTAKAGHGVRIKMLLILSPWSSLTCISHADVEKRPEWGGIVLCWPWPIFSYYKSSILLSPGMTDVLSSAKFLICKVSLWEKMVLFVLAHSSKPKITKITTPPKQTTKNPTHTSNHPPQKKPNKKTPKQNIELFSILCLLWNTTNTSDNKPEFSKGCPFGEPSFLATARDLLRSRDFKKRSDEHALNLPSF